MKAPLEKHEMLKQPARLTCIWWDTYLRNQKKKKYVASIITSSRMLSVPSQMWIWEDSLSFNSSSYTSLLENFQFRIKCSFDFQARPRNQAVSCWHHRHVPMPLRSYSNVACCYGAWRLISERRWLWSRQMNINLMTPVQNTDTRYSY